MTRYKLSLALAIILISLSPFAATNLYSQDPQDSAKEGRAVSAVKVTNNKIISTETIISKVKIRTGDKFSQDVLNDDLKRLYATGYFANVSIDVEDKDEGVVVTFIVDEKPIIEDVFFKGNKAFKEQKLKAAIKSKPNEMLNLAMLAQDIIEIKNLYIKGGYPSVDVKYTVDLDKDANKAKINISIEEKTHVKIGKIDIIGNKAIRTNDIRKGLATKPAWFFNPGVFKEDTLREDIENIKGLYDDLGFLDVDVTPKMEYTDGGSVINITIEVKEGKLYLVGDLNLKGNIVLPEKNVRSKITLKPGKPFSHKAMRLDAYELRQYYYDYGYMNVNVDIERTLNEATGKIDITYLIDARDPVYVGRIDIKGNTKTKDIVVRRELRIYPGEKYNGAKIKRSKERLYNLGFFENVSFDTEPTENPNVQNLVVSVKETKTGEFSFGGGYSSVDMLVGFAEVTQKNFDILNFPSFTGGGQTLNIKAELGMVRNNFNIGWKDPWIFGWPYSLGFDVYRTAHTKKEDLGWAYDEARTGGDIGIGKEFTDYLRGGLTYRLEDIKISNVVENASKDFKDEDGSNLTSSLLLELSQDTRDNIYNPMGGYVIEGTLENAGGFLGGDKTYLKGTASGAYYKSFFEKIVLEVRGRGGWMAAYGSSDSVPIYSRFFAGGAESIRGYKERKVGPRDPGSNEPIGGETILIGTAEVTFPLYEKLIKGAVFYDVGNVWKKSGDFFDGNMKAGVGVGVRVKTPLGPVKVDYGYPLSGNYDDERTGEFYFSMSRGF